jgi:16S rRNA (cytidine1402-2'-O)-methyltransferase
LLAAAARDVTSIFFESPHRLLKTLEACVQHFPERRLCVARELTKQFEEFRIGNAPELLAHYSAKPVKGEIVFLIAGQ